MSKYSVKFDQKKIVTLFAAIVAAVCLYYLIFNFEWLRIWQVMRRINWLTFALLSSATIFAYWFVRTLRWRALLPAKAKSISLLKLYFYTVFAVSLSTVTPFQAGEALKVELAQNENSSDGRFSMYAIFAFERALDLLAVLVLALVGLNAKLDARYNFLVLIVLAALTTGGAATFAAIFFAPVEKLRELRQKLRATWNFAAIAQAFVLTFAGWLLVALGWKLALQQTMIDLSLTESFVVVSLTAVIGVISFVPGAVGVSEVSTTQIITAFGYEPGLAQAGALIIRGYALFGLLLAIVHWIVLTKFIDQPKHNNLNGETAL